ncbi:MAG: response regulator [Nitrospinae bacterium]|nr:response regulator [Nitrospinota bacterium]
MKEIIKWLIEIEERAFRIYERSAVIFSDDKEFAEFLLHLSREEKLHCELIKRASEVIGDRSDYSALVYIDDSMKQNIEDYFSPCEKKIDTKEITKDDVIGCIIATEFSEWNNLFLYIINIMKHEVKEFISVIKKIQHHKRRIEQFLESQTGFSEKLQEMKKIPKIWEEMLLVVDDEPVIVDMLVAILEDEDVVDGASNGKDALKKLNDKYYLAIISDVDMPVMNGIEFFKKAVERYPDINKRFLFFTGSFDSEVLNFFKQNKIKYLPKPSSIADIKKAVFEVISR